MTWSDRDDDLDDRPRTVEREGVPFLPVLLIAFGVAAIFGQIGGSGFGAWHAFWLAAGVWCFVRGRNDGPYPLLVIGAFLIGDNVGELVGSLIDSGMADATSSLGAAIGLFWLYGNDRPRSRWAIWPAVVIGLIGIAELGSEVTELANAGGWILPAGVVVAGVLLLGAHRLPGPVRLAGLVFVGAAVLSLLGSGGDREPVRRTISTVFADSADLPEIDGRTVSVTTGSGDIDVVEGTEAAVSGSRLKVDTSGSAISVTASRGDIKLTVPEGTKLRLVTSSGDVDVAVPAADLDIRSGSGDIEAILVPLTEGGRATIVTSSGDIDLTVGGTPTVNATTGSGDVDAEDFDDEATPDNVLVSTGTTGTVVVTTGSGDITLTRDDEPVGAGLR